MNGRKLTDYDLCYKIGQIGMEGALRTISETEIVNPRTADYWKIARRDHVSENVPTPTYSMDEAIEIINSYVEGS